MSIPILFYLTLYYLTLIQLNNYLLSCFAACYIQPGLTEVQTTSYEEKKYLDNLKARLCSVFKLTVLSQTGIQSRKTGTHPFNRCHTKPCGMQTFGNMWNTSKLIRNSYSTQNVILGGKIPSWTWVTCWCTLCWRSSIYATEEVYWTRVQYSQHDGKARGLQFGQQIMWFVCMENLQGA